MATTDDPRNRRRVRWVFALGAAVFVYFGWAIYERFGGGSVRSNKEVGRSERLLRWSYGRPVEDWPENQPLGARFHTEAAGPIRTLVFHPWGVRHPAGGKLWVWLAERDGGWECVASCWFADGVKF